MKLRKVEFVLSAVKPAHYPAADRPEVAFAGRSNVGKSSLLNTLLGRRNLARVSRTPGRTQHINYFNVNDAIYLVDLPGYGYAKVPTAVRRDWGPMMERYLAARTTLRGMVILQDVRRDPGDEERMLGEALAARNVTPVWVLTKTDKLSKSQLNQRAQTIAKALGVPTRACVLFSSLSGRGREELWEVIDALCSPPAGPSTTGSEGEEHGG